MGETRESLHCHLSSPLSHSSGAACLCLCFWGSLLIGGFANGVVRIYDAKTGLRKVEIAAHSRCITALDVATEAGLVRVWVCVWEGGWGGGEGVNLRLCMCNLATPYTLTTPTNSTH